MKPRHAAALALVGWYLMVPPLKNGLRDYQAPISQWDQLWSYDSADRCQEDALKKFEVPKAPGKFVGEYLYGVKCIATDDPRLAN